MSSSAQLSLVPWLAGWPGVADRTRFAAGLHAGSAAGLALALRGDLRDLDPVAGAGLLLGALPAAAAGWLAQDAVEERLGNPGPTAVLLALGAGALWAADRRGLAHPRAASVSPGWTGWDVAAASVAQVAALAPGVSRAGATLTVLRARGLGREPALRLSLLMSLPVALGAAGLTAVRARRLPAATPTAAAGVSAYLASRSRPSARWVIAGGVVYRLLVAGAVARKLGDRRRRSPATVGT